MDEINLDTYAAARAEAEDTTIPVVFGGQTFQLPAEMPLSVAVVWDTQNGIAALELLFDGQWSTFAALEPTVPTLKELVQKLNVRYGLSEGESAASGEPSEKTGTRSRPTSSTGTRKT